ncbi:MAG: hypothetical protein ACXAE3_02365 [Candidatus Kariarchaeaceae archaeon]|jgi:hypothetical protein
MSSRESLATGYIFFRFPTYHALVLIPLIAGMISGMFVRGNLDLETATPLELVIENQLARTDAFLFLVKISLMILMSFFITFKWSQMKKDGSYGFWLTQLVSRRKYYLKSVREFIFTAYFGVAVGLAMLLFIGGIKLPTVQIIYLFVLALSSTIQMILVGILFAELLKDPELSTVAYILAISISIFGLTDRSSLLHQLFNSELHYYGDGTVISIALSWTVNLLLLGLTYLIHQRSGIDL